MSVMAMNGRLTPLQAGQISKEGPQGRVAGMPNQVSPPGLFPRDALPKGVEDIDDIKFKTNTFDPTYAASIHAHKRDLETKYMITRPLVGPKSHQPEITTHMRKTLLNWLVSLAEQMRLGLATYALTIHLIDEALTKITVLRSEFQLLGCTCLLIAAKLEELQPPLVNELVHRSDYCFDSGELIGYEQQLMTVFELQPALPTRYYFARRYAVAGNCTPRETAMVTFLTELSLYQNEFSLLPMSHVAAAAVHLTLQILRPLDADAPYTHLSRLIGGDMKEGMGGTMNIKNDLSGARRGVASEKDDDDEASQIDGEDSASNSDSGSDRAGGGGNKAARKREIWTESLEHYTQYREWELVDTVLKLREAHFSMEDTDLTLNIRGRYSRERYYSVSQISSLRVQDVRWDSEEAWSEFWAHPVSQGQRAGGVAAEPWYSQGQRQETQSVPLEPSLSTLSTRDLPSVVGSSHAPEGHVAQVLAKTQAQAQAEEQAYTKRLRQQQRQQQTGEDWMIQPRDTASAPPLPPQSRAEAKRIVPVSKGAATTKGKVQHGQAQIRGPGRSQAPSQKGHGGRRGAGGQGAGSGSVRARGGGPPIIGESLPVGQGPAGLQKVGQSRSAPLQRPKAGVPAAGSGGGSGSSNTNAGSIRPSGTSAFSAPAAPGTSSTWSQGLLNDFVSTAKETQRDSSCHGIVSSLAASATSIAEDSSTVTTAEDTSTGATAEAEDDSVACPTAAAYRAPTRQSMPRNKEGQTMARGGRAISTSHVRPLEEDGSFRAGKRHRAAGRDYQSSGKSSGDSDSARGPVQTRISDFAAVKLQR